jgi:hypothetical protein
VHRRGPDAAIAEVQRILEPGGRFIVVEHISGRGPLLRGLQRLLRGPWRWALEGCELDRDTGARIRHAESSEIDLREETVVTPFIAVNAFAYGSAIT